MNHFRKPLLIASILLTMGATDAFAQRMGRGPTRTTRTARPAVQRQQQQRPRQQIRPLRAQQVLRQRQQQQQQQQQSLPARLQPNAVRLSMSDIGYLNATAQRFEMEIRQSFTPVVDLHIPDAMRQSGVTMSYVNRPYSGKGPTIIKLQGADKLNGPLELVMTGGASGHVMQQTYGGRPFSTVEKYGREDTVHLTYKKPGASSSEHVVQVKSRGLVTQEGFTVTPTKGTHNFYYFRTSPSGGSGGEGSEPELRHVQIIVE